MSYFTEGRHTASSGFVLEHPRTSIITLSIKGYYVDYDCLCYFKLQLCCDSPGVLCSPLRPDLLHQMHWHPQLVQMHQAQVKVECPRIRSFKTLTCIMKCTVSVIILLLQVNNHAPHKPGIFTENHSPSFFPIFHFPCMLHEHFWSHFIFQLCKTWWQWGHNVIMVT